MQNEIKKYPVQHPLLKKYIKFYWELRIENMQFDHKIIPVRNIDLMFNLEETQNYLSIDCKESLLEGVFFSGLHDHFRNERLKINGKAAIIGVCFLPYGLYPFLKIPMSEFKNQILGTDEIGFKTAGKIRERLKESEDISRRLAILEYELVKLLDYGFNTPENFPQLFNFLKQKNGPMQIAEFCKNNIGMRTLERMYNKYVGISAQTYGMLNRFQNSANQLLYKKNSKLSDIAYSYDYFDHMHFIKEFKRFTGNTPKNFLHQSDSLMHIGKPF